MPRRTAQLAVVSLTLGILAAVPLPASSAAPASTSAATSAAAKADPRVGHGKRGLVSARGAGVAHCPGHMYVARETRTCVHGADEAPRGIDVTQPRTVEQLRDIAYGGAAPAEVASTPGVTTPSTDGSGQIVCEGDGVSGKRIQVLYVRTSAVPSRFAALRDALEQNVIFADRQFNASAAQTGGARHLRFVTVPDVAGGCTLDLREVVIPPTADLTFGYTVNALQEQGWDSKSRKYLMLTDADYLCGVGTFYGDDRSGAENVSNWYAAQYARVDTGCWHYAEAHELMHNLGGVQDSAPHSSGAGHCYDGADDMCYSDGGSWFLGPDGLRSTADDRLLQQLCLRTPLSTFDCNHDDYFHTAPISGSYLATHWNTAMSAYLIAPTVTSSSTVQVLKPANQSGSYGTPVTPLQVIAADFTPGQVLTYSAAGLPAGLSISPSIGVVSGTPTEAGAFNVVVSVADGSGASGSASFTWTVSPVVPAVPTLVTATAKDGGVTLTVAPPVSDGGSAITGYAATASTGETVSGFSPLVFSGLSNGVTRTFTVRAGNVAGSGVGALSRAVTFWSSSLTVYGGRTVVAGTAATLTGRLTTGAAGARALTLTATPYGRLAVRSTVTTASDGTWRAAVKPLWTTSYRISWAGDATHQAAASGVAGVPVATRVVLTSPRSGTRTTNRVLRVTGTTSPNKAGRTVKLYEVSSTGALSYRASAVVEGNGTFALSKRFGTGTHRLTVLIGAATGNVSGRSATITVYEV